MTEQEKKIALDSIYRELWYRNYIDALVKAYEVSEDTCKMLTKVSKPEVTTDALEEAFNKLYTTEEVNEETKK